MKTTERNFARRLDLTSLQLFVAVCELGSIGMVVGATVGDAVRALGLDLASADAPLLAPGVGAQGATGQDLRTVFGSALPHVLAASSREILSAGPQVVALRDGARRTAEHLIELMGES